jgi:hypothetical protein
MKEVKIDTFEELKTFLKQTPEETLCDRLPSDLHTGNFDDAHFTLPSGEEVHLSYKGPVMELESSDPDYCGSCRSNPCLVISGQLCCHQMVIYGFCRHNPLP